MLNLLPDSAKKRVRQEYLLRLSVLAASALAVLAGVSALLIFPTYVSVSAKHAALLNDKQAAESSPEHDARKKASADLAAIKSLLARASAADTSIHPSDILGVVLSKKTSGIVVNTLDYQTAADGAPSVYVQGLALRRANLVAFSNALKDTGLFSKVDLPVSDLADSDNIPYNLTLTVLVPKKP